MPKAKKTSRRTPPTAATSARAKGRAASATSDREVAALITRIQKLESLLDVAKAMTAERDLDNLLKLILAESVEVVDADRCTLWIVDRERNELWTKVAQGLETDHT